MNWELKNIISEIEIVKEKLDDITTVHTWFVDGNYVLDDISSHSDLKEYGFKYKEHRIHNNHILDLLMVYMKRFDDLIKEIEQIEKASSAKFGDRTDNA
ncbi:type II toxin-antitoxin system toxin TscT [Staphylococcus agnetis]|uniref:type II toxin-antitoxin system toxin TscT n=1 Tax=Staphylococcus agnetis TaxID=985762 RepID=UPI000CD31AEC|nr:DUF1474 family protein [Staphylococcus agnetis]PNY87683.1 pathogenicity island protein [Staphylococcus agnetis]